MRFNFDGRRRGEGGAKVVRMDDIADLSQIDDTCAGYQKNISTKTRFNNKISHKMGKAGALEGFSARFPKQR